ncbi:MAG: carboxypeptidase regulatory-like domain-containing protein [Byssovorax sp.]
MIARSTRRGALARAIVLGVALLVPALGLGPTTRDAQAQPASAPSAAPGSGSGLHVHVRGTAELQVAASSEPDGFSIRGELIDDAGSPIPRASITIQAFAPDDLRTPIRLASLEPCEAPTIRGRGGVSADGAIDTDERGTFCVVGKATIPKVVFKVRYAGSKLHDAFETQLSVEPDQDHLLRTLVRFEPPPETVDLDKETVTITASLRIDRSDASRPGSPTPARREGIALTLEDEKAKPLAEAATGGDGRARFEVKTATFAGPGAGEVIARFAGKPGIAKASIAQPIVRRADVHLALMHPIERADADDGFAIDVDVTTGRGAVEGGVVEVIRSLSAARSSPVTSGESVGAGEVAHGHARVVVSFASGGASTVPILLRYVPSAPWYRAGPALQTEVNLAGPGILKEILVALVVLAAGAWVVGGWRRAPKAPVAPSDLLAPAVPPGKAGVQVLGPARNATGWSGVVSDAHEGTPIVGARLAIIAPSFQGDGVVAEVHTDEHGAFTIDAPHRSDARLVVESALHSAYEQALPPPSALGVALVTRRRALLDRLVRWARRQGAPYDGTPEPTPGHVRRVAARGSAEEIEAWARRVEHVAYGPDPVVEPVEREVRGVEPRALR